MRFLSVVGSRNLYYLPEFEDLTSYKEIHEYISHKVKYDINDNPSYVNHPKETLDTGKGSCGDIAVLFMNIAYFGMGIRMNLLLVDLKDENPSRAIISGNFIDHAVLTYNNEIIEPQKGIIVDYKEAGFVYRFDEVFSNH